MIALSSGMKAANMCTHALWVYDVTGPHHNTMIGIFQIAPEDLSGHTGAMLECRFRHVARVRVCVD